MRIAVLVFVSVLLAFASGARAAACPGADGWVFDDIDAADPFCSFVTWMAQEKISQGCEAIDAGHRRFCPNDPTTRAQMSAFMKRLADATAPVKAWGIFQNNAGSVLVAFPTGNVVPFPTVTQVQGMTRDVGTIYLSAAGVYKIHYCLRLSTPTGAVTPTVVINGITLPDSSTPPITTAGTYCLDTGVSVDADAAVQLVLTGNTVFAALQPQAGAELVIERLGP